MSPSPAASQAGRLIADDHRKRVVEPDDLDQQRRRAEELHIEVDRGHQDAMPAQHGDAADETDEEPASNRRRGVDQGDGRAAQPLVGTREDEREIPVVDHPMSSQGSAPRAVLSIQILHQNTCAIPLDVALGPLRPTGLLTR